MTSENRIVEGVFQQTATRGNNEPIPHSKTNFDKQHKGEISRFSNSISRFYKRNDFKEEDKLVGLAHFHPASVKEQRTAASLRSPVGASTEKRTDRLLHSVRHSPELG